MTYPFSIPFAFSISLLCAYSAAIEQADKDAVRTISNSAAADFHRGAYRDAKQKFERAYEVARVPRLAVWLAQTNEKLGLLVLAYENYREALTLVPIDIWIGDAQQQAQREAQTGLDRLEPRIPRIAMAIEGASPEDVSVKIDNAPVPHVLVTEERRVDPGSHEIVATWRDEAVRVNVLVAEGERKRVTLRFAHTETHRTAPARGVTPAAKLTPAHSDPRKSVEQHARPTLQRTFGWAGIGVGAASLTFGAAMGIVVGIKHSTLESECQGHTCPSEKQGDIESYRAMRTASSMGFIAGGLIGAAGLTLLSMAPRHPDITAKLWVSPHTVGLGTEF